MTWPTTSQPPTPISTVRGSWLLLVSTVSNRKHRQRRPQTPKVGNLKLATAMMEKRSSNAAGPHTPNTNYRRRPKHVNLQFEEN